MHLILLIYSSVAEVYKIDLQNTLKETIERQTYISDNAVKRIRRAITTSQVLTFNITNALILLGLKAILIGAGILGKISFWKYPNLGGVPSGRVLNSSDHLADQTANQLYYSLISNEDIRWSSAYIWAINKNDFGCLYQLACQKRHSANIYLKNGRYLAKTIDTIFSYLNVSYNKHYYEIILNGIQEAMDSSGGNSGDVDDDECQTKYRCSAPFGGLNLKQILNNFG
ncbi:uncharacterized protein LOC128966252 [Oppia nitens]|uniref:uncharacterized protein LOC128966252 n=1 Tax=Oppia nitens TaxID=1686743 RepID=UPI0023D978CF|nr:uncharacterized protein LOC128966252 [Oppia nitens]